MSAVKTNDLQAFLAVAQEQSFTKAAVRLGVTPSALSHSMRLLEERLGIRLLARTTRNVSPTEAGERLMHSIAPHFEAIGASVEALGDLRDRPAGTLRISCTDDSMETIIRPRLAGFLAEYPDITLEFYVDYGFTNVVEQRFDAGIRLGEALSKDMIAVRVGPDWRLVVVASPDYFKKHPKPRKPRRHHATQMRAHPASSKRCHLRLGVRGGRQRVHRTRRRPTGVQQHDPRRQRRRGRTRLGLCARTDAHRAYRGGQAGSRIG